MKNWNENWKIFNYYYIENIQKILKRKSGTKQQNKNYNLKKNLGNEKSIETFLLLLLSSYNIIKKKKIKKE